MKQIGLLPLLCKGFIFGFISAYTFQEGEMCWKSQTKLLSKQVVGITMQCFAFCSSLIH